LVSEGKAELFQGIVREIIHGLVREAELIQETGRGPGRIVPWVSEEILIILGEVRELAKLLY
jgi:hypothetical protein